jgi:cytochrome c oxidase assembly protein subunit 15
MNNNRKIAIWLFICCFMVAMMVLVGGLTRLTESGLSITSWKPFTGAIPPLNDADWQAEFSQYQASPEYQKINKGMSIDEFKFIFWWEYIHRLLGRILGLVFAIPFAYFAAKKYIDRNLTKKLLGIFALGGLQGFMGWFMVKSGLSDNPYVSHFRLAAHLGLALIIFSCMFLLGRELLDPTQNKHSLPKLKRINNISILLIFVQIIFGAFVAGLNAGFVYNTWPLMNGEFAPDEAFKTLAFFSDAASVQFIHRWFAFLVAGHLIATYFVNFSNYKQAKCLLPASSLVILVVLQIAIGIATLLLMGKIGAIPDAVWIAHASAHQILAVLLLANALWLRSRV